MGESVTGLIASGSDETSRALLIGIDAPSDAHIIVGGDLIIRFGVLYLGKPFVMVPGLIAIDYGIFLNGSDAWAFLLHRSNLYPRAEVFGYRSDGHDDMITVKMLDLAQPIRVLCYADTDATSAITPVDAVIAAPTHAISAQLSEYLPRYETWDDWQQA